MQIHQLDTPCLILDLDVMERNLRRYQDYFNSHGLGFRPHIKTHKIPALAHRQLALGAVGITCQKLGEVEVMADAGIRDILLYYNILGPAKLERLIRLARRTELKVTVDNLIVGQGISDAAVAAGVVVDVLAEMGGPNNRTGAPTVPELLTLAQDLDRLPGLRLRGMAVYPSGPANADAIAQAVAGFRRAGLSTEIVSGGGTPDAFLAHTVPEITEHRAGTYIFMDKMMVEADMATVDDCAVTVLTTVASRPTDQRAILDGGTKTFSSDRGLPMGIVVDHPAASIYMMNEEHGYLDISQCDPSPQIGDRLRVIPNHVCGCINMHDEIYGVRGDEVEVVWQIQARGKVR